MKAELKVIKERTHVCFDLLLHEIDNNVYKAEVVYYPNTESLYLLITLWKIVNNHWVSELSEIERNYYTSYFLSEARKKISEKSII